MLRRLAVVAAAASALLAVVLPGAAPAKGGDRNHDRLPDRWERAHGLSLKVDQARRDQDRDGVRNLGEYRQHTDPRNADSDGDGVHDGDEHAGTIQAFDGARLTIALAAGGTLTAEVDRDTEIECEGSDGERGDDHGHHGHHGDDDEDCGAEALQPGAIVEEAEVEASGGRAVFGEIELHVAA